MKRSQVQVMSQTSLLSVAEGPMDFVKIGTEYQAITNEYSQIQAQGQA